MNGTPAFFSTLSAPSSATQDCATLLLDRAPNSARGMIYLPQERRAKVARDARPSHHPVPLSVKKYPQSDCAKQIALRRNFRFSEIVS